MHLLLLLSAFSWLLGHVTAQGGKPEKIVTYEPLTDVRDQARIDLDQMAIINLLEFGDFAAAEAIYQKGSHSKSMSNLTLAEPLTIDIPQGANLVGESTSGKMVQVFAQAQSYAPGATYILVQYKDEDCYAGANPKPVVTGCLVARGNLTEETTGMSIAYQYEPTSSYNLYSIQYFTKGTEFIFEKGGNFTVDFQKFVDFYGSDNYADDIITAAFQGRSTNFSTGKNVDASVLRNDGRAQISQGGTAYIAIMMYVLRELEHAIFLCKKGVCAEASCLGKEPVHEVDEAVAFYAGSLAPDKGVLMYNLAENRSKELVTTVNGTAGLSSKENVAIFKAFESAKDHIVANDCGRLRVDTTEISRLMTIPLVQSTLELTYLTDIRGVKMEEAEHAKRAIFAASVLPYVNSCNRSAAEIIYNNTKAGAAIVNHTAVHKAFENVYSCLNITSDDIGDPRLCTVPWLIKSTNYTKEPSKSIRGSKSSKKSNKDENGSKKGSKAF